MVLRSVLLLVFCQWRVMRGEESIHPFSLPLPPALKVAGFYVNTLFFHSNNSVGGNPLRVVVLRGVVRDCALSTTDSSSKSSP